MPTYLCQDGANEGFTFTREQAVRMDEKFSKAMLHAARRGLERPPKIGVVVDDTPFRPTYFARESALSLYSSSSQMCVDFAGQDRETIC